MKTSQSREMRQGVRGTPHLLPTAQQALPGLRVLSGGFRNKQSERKDGLMRAGPFISRYKAI